MTITMLLLVMLSIGAFRWLKNRSPQTAEARCSDERTYRRTDVPEDRC